MDRTIAEDVILVGNGPSVLGKTNGEWIDSFRDVVRFNNYQIAGYETCVGTKTTIWSRRTDTIRPIVERDCSQFSEVLAGLRPDQWEHRDKHPLPDGWTPIPNYAEQYGGKILSLGTLTTLFLLDRGFRPTLVGFDFFGATQHHYFQDEVNNYFYDGEFERGLLNREKDRITLIR